MTNTEALKVVEKVEKYYATHGSIIMGLPANNIVSALQLACKALEENEGLKGGLDVEKVKKVMQKMNDEDEHCYINARIRVNLALALVEAHRKGELWGE